MAVRKKNSLVGGFEHHVFLIHKEQCSQKLGLPSANICLISTMSQNVQEHLKFRLERDRFLASKNMPEK